MLCRAAQIFARSKPTQVRKPSSPALRFRTNRAANGVGKPIRSISKSRIVIARPQNFVSSFRFTSAIIPNQSILRSRKFASKTAPATMDKAGVTYPNMLRFDLTAEEITAWPAKIIDRSRKALDAVAASVNAPSWESTIMGIMDEDADFGTEASNCTFFAHVHTDKTIRDASTEAEKELDKYAIEKSQRYDVYLAVKAYVDKQSAKDQLNKEQKYALEQMMRDFTLAGMTLDEEKREEVKAIKSQISELSIEFSRNIAEDKTRVLFTRAQLNGVSDTVIKSLGKEGEGADEKIVVTMKYPELLPVLEKANDPATREALATANARRCMDINVPLLEKALELRQRLAILLGFESPAHHVLANKMAPSPAAVMSFLKDLDSKLESAHAEELSEALKVKEKACKDNGYEFDGKIRAWDRLYTEQLILARDYKIDHEAIAEYFPMQHVVQATLEIYQELFGVSFSKTQNPHVWHPDVIQYDVSDSESKQFIGQFYLDLHPRDGKYTHAAEFGLVKSCLVRGKRQHPIAAMVANFTKPTEDTPSLLRHGEVTTWAHELGHVLHDLLGASSYSPWAGTSTARDFVEAPSQALENWCFEREALVRLSKHHKTGEVLPDELITALVKSKNAGIATHLRRQLFFGIFDMTLHSLTPADPKVNTQQLWQDLSVKITRVPAVEASNGVATFGHIMGGYQACYYGYLWSEVFAADIFKQFKKAGIFNTTVGKTYRNKVLAPGGSRSEMESLVDFLGREPTNEAFLEHIGLAPSS